ncbi:hypothetical protein [Streptomyces sp. NRRL B-3229]|uniref:hypothetical protein n=1 Tax=Streptomyces sp. NRRL B-3229 TaxID=1463836 RepID=UPI00131EA2F8|nr:hypothetical protein [Streptomyces sp. NRRL B-3229]
MTTPPNISLSTILHRCRLGRRELDALFTVAGQGYQPNEIVFRHFRHSRTFSAPTLADLIADVQAAPLPGDPNHWDNLSFTATDPAGRRTVTMSLSPKKVVTTVSGNDATLVYGTDAQIRLFLVDDAIGGRTSPKAPPSGPLNWVLVAGIALIFILALALSFEVDGGPAGDSVNKALEASGPFIVIGYGLLGFLAAVHGAANVWVSRGVLAPTRSLPTGGVWSRLAMPERIAVVGLLVAVAGSVGTLISAGTDLFG